MLSGTCSLSRMTTDPVRVRLFHASWSVPSYPAVRSAREIAQVLKDRVLVKITDISSEPPVDVAAELGRPLSTLRLPLWILERGAAGASEGGSSVTTEESAPARIVLEGAHPKFEVVDAIERLWAEEA